MRASDSIGAARSLAAAVAVAAGLLALALLSGAGTRGTVRGASGTSGAKAHASVIQWPASQLRLSDAWTMTRGSASVVIAVVDTGVTPSPELAGALVQGIDLFNNDADPHDDNGHGSAIAKIAAARSGIQGVCGRCSIMPVKVLGTKSEGRSPTVAEGVRWAVAHGARVVNVSIGAAQAQPELNAALEDAIAHGVVVVIAAGNNGSRNPAEEGYPAASVTDAIRVGATGQNGKLATWSNHGPWVDTAAPGYANLPFGKGLIQKVQGTSFSAAYVSGLAGLLLSQDPTLTPADVKALVVDAGRPVAGVDLGSGRIANAATALTAALHRAPVTATQPAAVAAP